MTETKPKERPILFSGPMVRAILDGRKTQTRRVVKRPRNKWDMVYDFDQARKDGPEPFHSGEYLHVPFRRIGDRQWPGTSLRLFCQIGVPGDRLWVRETFHPHKSCLGPASYRATWGNDDPPDEGWMPSIFMPRRASRITLEIISVRVERLQDITAEDAKAEGLSPDQNNPALWTWPGYPSGSTNPVYAFELLWDLINDKTHPWASNPWVWVISFKRTSSEQSPNI